MIASHDMPPFQQERLVCAITAAVKYQIPANILLAIAEQENGKPGLWVKNSNGTYDVGVMQFNTRYLSDLAKYGIEPQDVASTGCYAYDLAAWRIRGHLQQDKDDLWTRAANYHSRTPQKNRRYRTAIIQKAQKWNLWLKEHVTTYPVTRAKPTPGYKQAAMVNAVIDRMPSAASQPHPKPVKRQHHFNQPAAMALAAVFRPSQGSPVS